jgi:hypothetical protein
MTEVDDLIRARNAAWDAARRTDNFDAYNELNTQMAYVGGLAGNLMAAGRYNATRKLFRKAVRRIFVLGTIAALGIGAFAWAVNPPGASQPHPLPFQAPVGAALTLTEQGKQELGTSLDPKCFGKPVKVIVLGVDAGELHVVSIPGSTCRAAIFNVSELIGHVSALQVVQLRRN